MYDEILELEQYCAEVGVKTTREKILDGYCLRFAVGDVVQHSASYGSNVGCVEFGYTGFEKVDFEATNLINAKKFIKQNRSVLNGGKSCNEIHG